ncbi:hypothetical protein [Burkholderia phage BCSR5]|nr:hypothetical protein [Burkholderia phage BCSR5]
MAKDPKSKQDKRMEKRHKQFAALKDEIRKLSTQYWSVFANATIGFSSKKFTSKSGHKTEGSYLTAKNRAFHFVFEPSLWDKLNAQERVFEMLHLVTHQLNGHFKRFKNPSGELESKAMDLATNHLLMSKFSFDLENMPYVKEKEQFVWNVQPEGMQPNLSAEEYMFALKAHQQQQEKLKQEQDDEDQEDDEGESGDSDNSEEGDGDEAPPSSGGGSQESEEDEDGDDTDSSSGSDESDESDGSDDSEDNDRGGSGSDADEADEPENGDDEDSSSDGESDEEEAEDADGDSDSTDESSDGSEDGEDDPDSDADGEDESESDGEPDDAESDDGEESDGSEGDPDDDDEPAEGYDDHDRSVIDPEDLQEILDDAKEILAEEEDLSDDEAEDQLKDAATNDPPKSKMHQAGLGADSGFSKDGGNLKYRDSAWRSFSLKLLKGILDAHGKTSWLPNKRFASIQRSFGPKVFLPSSLAPAKRKIKVVVFLDTSGSCWMLRPYFFGLLKAIPTDLFDISTYVFTTTVKPFDINNPIFPAGGTSYVELESYFEKEREEITYAFVFSDGDIIGKFLPKNPQAWHFFMDPNNMDTSHLHPAIKVHSIEPFIK